MEDVSSGIFAASETQETSSERTEEAIDRLGGTQAAA